MDKPLQGMRVAILATDMFEEAELAQPQQALENAGATTEIISVKPGEIIAANHFDKSKPYPVDATLDEVVPEDYDALLLPGGALNADFLRVDKRAQDFARSFDESTKPIAVICHGPWLLVSAGLVKGRTLTAFYTIADDITNAGGHYVDEEVVRDANWVSSRQPDDLPAFNREMVDLFYEHRATDSAQNPQEAELAFRETLENDDNL